MMQARVHGRPGAGGLASRQRSRAGSVLAPRGAPGGIAARAPASPPRATGDGQPQGPLQALANVLLNRAASRVERGETTCLTCRGTGQCTCPACKGAGTLSPAAAASHNSLVKHAAQKLRATFDSRAEYSTDWLRTNRCTRCHGVGGWVCPDCDGAGARLINANAPRGASRRGAAK